MSYQEDLTEKYNQAIKYHKHGDLERAIVLYKQLLTQAPTHTDVLHMLGVAYAHQNNKEQALDFFNQTLAVNPQHVHALSNRANILQELLRYDEALSGYDAALAVDPHFVDCMTNRGALLEKMGHAEKALAQYDRALQISPYCVSALVNRAIILNKFGQYTEALFSYDRALACDPRHAIAWFNRGNLLQSLQRSHEALLSYEKSLRINPHDPKTNYNQSWSLLSLGDFKRGWQQHEWRWEAQTRDKPERLMPAWTGKEPLTGKTILLDVEQGFGDMIQFARYATYMSEQGANVILTAAPDLADVLATVKGVKQILTTGHVMPDHDYHCLLMSLPFLLSDVLPDIPSAQAYIKSDEAKRYAWENKLINKTKVRVGLAWSGSQNHGNDHHRSVALEKLNTLHTDQVQFYSVQKECRITDQPALAARKDMQFFGDELIDFSDTAALVDILDLVITVDTSVAHLAGALGKPTWVMLPFDADWRWMHDREDSIWYPSVKLFRQKKIGDWDSVVQAVNAALLSFCLSKNNLHG